MDTKHRLTKEEALALGDEILNAERRKRLSRRLERISFACSQYDGRRDWLFDRDPFFDPTSPYYFYYHSR